MFRATLLPGLGAWDTAEAQTVLPLMGTMHPTGFPAYVLLGWLASVVLAPLGSPALRINLLSALLVAVAVASLVFVARRLGANLIVAVGVAVGFALTPIVWQIAVAADAHALQLALLGVLVLSLLRWETLVEAWRADPGRKSMARADRALLAVAAVFGVALANHGLTLLLVPAVGAYVVSVERAVLHRRRLATTAVMVCLGVAAALYLELPMRAGPFRAPLVYGHPETWSGFLDVVLARQFQGGASGLLTDPAGALTSPFGVAAAQYGPLVLLIPLGLAATIARHPRYALLSGVATALTCLFAASYENADIGRYYLGPAFFAWTWIAVLASVVVGWAAGPTGPDDRRPVWHGQRSTVALALVVVLLVPTATVLPARWRAIDSSEATWASDWLDEAFTAMEPNAAVLSWWSYSTPMWYGQLIEGRRPDVEIVDDRTRLDEHLGSVADVIGANLGTRPVYVIRATGSDLQAVADRFVIVPVGLPANLYRVTGRQETSP